MNLKIKHQYTNDLRKFLSGVTQTSSDEAGELAKISVVTASYNQASFLERTIRSVINQGYSNVEHIVIDGGSTDGSQAILEKYDDYLSYWVSEPDEGQTHAINKGIEKATGDLIGFQNSDDIYLSGSFWRVAKAASDNPGAGIIYGDFLHIDKDDNVLDEQILGSARLWIQIMLGPQIHNQAAFWRKTVIDDIGLLDQQFVFDMDYEYFSRILAAGYRAVHVPAFLGAFRHHSAAKTSNLGEISKRELNLVANYFHQQTKFLRYLPRKLGRPLAMFVKATNHILDGRCDYLVRNRIQFK